MAAILEKSLYFLKEAKNQLPPSGIWCIRYPLTNVGRWHTGITMRTKPMKFCTKRVQYYYHQEQWINEWLITILCKCFPGTQCDNGWSYFDGSCYIIPENEFKTWDDALVIFFQYSNLFNPWWSLHSITLQVTSFVFL